MNNIDWEKIIDQITNETVNSFGRLTGLAINWKPNQDSWSIAQNIEHLIITNESYFGEIEKLNNKRYSNIPYYSKFNFIPSILGKTILQSVQSRSSKKTKTFPIWEPNLNPIPVKIIEHFSEHQLELKKEIRNSKELLKKNTVICSPANRYIVYNLETAFDIIIAHEQRHVKQSKKVLDLFKRKNNIHR